MKITQNPTSFYFGVILAGCYACAPKEICLDTFFSDSSYFVVLEILIHVVNMMDRVVVYFTCNSSFDLEKSGYGMLEIKISAILHAFDPDKRKVLVANGLILINS